MPELAEKGPSGLRFLLNLAKAVAALHDELHTGKNGDKLPHYKGAAPSLSGRNAKERKEPRENRGCCLSIALHPIRIGHRVTEDMDDSGQVLDLPPNRYASASAAISAKVVAVRTGDVT
jgi:hypothetical protein